MKKKLLAAGPLRTVLTIGLILALLISWGMVLFALIWGRDFSARGVSAGNSFSRSLRDYDLLNAPEQVMAGENPNQIERRLSALHRQAGSVEEHLSVLKRRRVLALIDRSYISGYAQAARQAAEDFPYSAPLAAVAAEAALLGGTPLSANSQAFLKNYASRITQNRFDLLGLSLHILAGNLANPSLAAEIPAIENLFSVDLSGFPEQTRRDLQVNEFLILAYKGNASEASRKLNDLLSTAASGGNRNDILMGAEFFYDNNSPHRAAELFLQLGGDVDNARAADALALGGEVPGARNIWLALSSPSPAENSQSRQIRFRSLYNLAASSANQAEELSWLERLFAQQRGFEDNMETYSVIRYTRLLDESRSTAILNDEAARRNPLLDLELHRRRLETLPRIRAIAETWLLIGRHNESEAIYEWAAWYFEHQRFYDELTHLLLEAERNGVIGSWLDLHRGLAFIREGHISRAEEILKEAISPDRVQVPGRHSAGWRIYANLGRIQESRRAISSALEYYETAAALVEGKTDAAQLLLRISRCMEALGRIQESRRVLERALELDPDDIIIRRQLRRFMSDYL